MKVEERLAVHDEKFDEILLVLKSHDESLKNIRHEVDKLSSAYAITLEDIAVSILPRLLKDDKIRLNRKDIRIRYPVKIDSKTVEVDLYAIGKRNKKSIIVIGETKSRIDAGDVRKFVRKLRYRCFQVHVQTYIETRC